jgi:hypothetical protein
LITRNGLANLALSLPTSDSAPAVPLGSETGALTTSAPAHAVSNLGPAHAGAKPVAVLPGRGEDLKWRSCHGCQAPVTVERAEPDIRRGKARRAHAHRARTDSLAAAALQ